MRQDLSHDDESKRSKATVRGVEVVAINSTHRFGKFGWIEHRTIAEVIETEQLRAIRQRGGIKELKLAGVKRLAELLARERAANGIPRDEQDGAA
jgi:hypothetical protein